MVFIAVVFSVCSIAQVPEKMNYQGLIRNSENSIIGNQTIRMLVSIVKGSIEGDPVYIEMHNPKTNANGLFTIEVGSGVVVFGQFSTIDWGSNSYFIKTEIDPQAGSNYTVVGATQLLSVPYALHAKTAGNSLGTSFTPRSAVSGNSFTVSFSGGSGIEFSEASPVALYFGEATPLYPQRIFYINNKQVDVGFSLPGDTSLVVGTYDVVINPNSDEPIRIEHAFRIFGWWE